jgi:putative tricarboxylic transport membrane protein
MADHPETVYAAFITLILANFLMIPAAMIVVRSFGYIIKLPTPVLLGLIVVCSLIGVYIPRGNLFDLPVALLIGMAAFLMRIGHFPIAPLLIGYVLGPELEMRLSQAAVYKGDMSLVEYVGTSPIAMVLFLAAAFFLFYPMLRPLLVRKVQDA